jgi:hypothetical protein
VTDSKLESKSYVLKSLWRGLSASLKLSERR